MIHHQVDDEADPALLGGVGKFDEIAKRPVARVNLIIVRGVIAAVAAGRGLKRHEPDCGYAEPMQIVEAPHESGKVADAVAVGIHVSVHGQAIDDGVLVPQVVVHREAPLLAADNSAITPSLARKAIWSVSTSSCRSRCVES